MSGFFPDLLSYKQCSDSTGDVAVVWICRAYECASLAAVLVRPGLRTPEVFYYHENQIHGNPHYIPVKSKSNPN